MRLRPVVTSLVAILLGFLTIARCIRTALDDKENHMSLYRELQDGRTELVIWMNTSGSEMWGRRIPHLIPVVKQFPGVRIRLASRLYNNFTQSGQPCQTPADANPYAPRWEEGQPRPCYLDCTNEGRYCFAVKDSNYRAQFSGAEALREIVELQCLWELYAYAEDSEPLSSFLWAQFDDDYVESLSTAMRCAFRARNVSQARECQRSVLVNAEVDLEALDECMAAAGGLETNDENTILEWNIEKTREEASTFAQSNGTASLVPTLNVEEPWELVNGTIQAILCNMSNSKPEMCTVCQDECTNHHACWVNEKCMDEICQECDDLYVNSCLRRGSCPGPCWLCRDQQLCWEHGACPSDLIDPHAKQVTEFDLWFDFEGAMPDADALAVLVAEFKEVVRIEFVPRVLKYFGCPVCDKHCTNGGLYCIVHSRFATSAVSGAEIMRERLVQTCLWELYAYANNSAPLWSYLKGQENPNFNERQVSSSMKCFLATKDIDEVRACQEAQLLAADIDTDSLQTCIESSGGLESGSNTILERSAQTSGLLGGWNINKTYFLVDGRYQLIYDLVDALCSVSSLPDKCSFCSHCSFKAECWKFGRCLDSECRQCRDQNECLQQGGCIESSESPTLWPTLMREDEEMDPSTEPTNKDEGPYPSAEPKESPRGSPASSSSTPPELDMRLPTQSPKEDDSVPSIEPVLSTEPSTDRFSDEEFSSPAEPSKAPPPTSPDSGIGISPPVPLSIDNPTSKVPLRQQNSTRIFVGCIFGAGLLLVLARRVSRYRNFPGYGRVSQQSGSPELS